MKTENMEENKRKPSLMFSPTVTERSRIEVHARIFQLLVKQREDPAGKQKNFIPSAILTEPASNSCEQCTACGKDRVSLAGPPLVST